MPLLNFTFAIVAYSMELPNILNLKAMDVSSCTPLNTEDGASIKLICRV
jgi:hypothetical protein